MSISSENKFDLLDVRSIIFRSTRFWNLVRFNRSSFYSVVAGFFLGMVAAMATAILPIQGAMAEDKEAMTSDGDAPAAEFLFMQRAQSGTITKEDEAVYTLELSETSIETIVFSSRPQRVVKTISTDDFMDGWAEGSDSFAADPPNAALIVEDIETGELESAIVVLLDPAYEISTGTLTYTVSAEDGASIDLPGEFGQPILIIDSTALCAGCGGRQCPPC